MKTSKMLLTVALSSMVAVACTPRDKTVVSDAERAQILSKKRGGGSTLQTNTGSGKTVEMNERDMAAFMMEKQGEILQIASAYQLGRAQTLGAYSVSEASSDQDSVQRLVLGAHDYTLQFGDFTQVQNSAWEITVVRRDDDKSVTLVSAALSSPALTSLKSGADGNAAQTVDLQENQADVRVAVADGNTSKVNYRGSGTLVIGKKGVKETLTYSLSADLSVASATLKEENLTITGGTVAINVIRGDGSRLNVKIIDQGNVTFANGTCPAVNGVSAIDNKYKDKVVFDANGVSIKVPKYPYASKHAPCGQRPVVDLSRVLIY